MDNLTRRGFFGTLTALTVGAVAKFKAKPTRRADGLSADWERYFNQLTTQTASSGRLYTGANVGETIRIRLPQRYVTTPSANG